MSGGTVKRRLGDRRARPRFEIVGELFGSLETVLRLPLKNVGIGGALFESHVPLAAESIHRLTWKCDDHETAVQVRVRHVKPVQSADGERTAARVRDLRQLSNELDGDPLRSKP